MVINEIISHSEKIVSNINNMAYMCYFCSELGVPYRDLLNVLKPHQVIELYYQYEVMFTYENGNCDLVDELLHYFSQRTYLSSSVFDKVFKILETTSYKVKKSSQQFRDLYLMMPLQVKQRVLHILLYTKCISVEKCVEEIKGINGNSSNKGECIYYIAKAVVECKHEDLLVQLKGISELDSIIEKIIEQKIAILAYDLNKLCEIDFNKYCPQEKGKCYIKEMEDIITTLNIQITGVKKKLTSLWTHEYVDSKNSLLSDYALSDRINRPVKIMNSVSAISRFTIGNGYGCLLTRDKQVVVIDIDDPMKIRKIQLAGELITGPVIFNNRIAIGQENEFSVYMKDGLNCFMEFVDGNIISVKAINDYIFVLTQYGKIYRYSLEEEIKCILDEELCTDIQDLLLLDDFIIVTTSKKVKFYKHIDEQVEFINEYIIGNIIRVVAHKNICFVMSNRSIVRIDIEAQTVNTYNSIFDFDENHMIVENEHSVIISINTRLAKIDFNYEPVIHNVFFEVPDGKVITDVINCSGTYAVIMNKVEVATLKNEKGVFSISSIYSLEKDTSQYLMSTGYGNLYVASCNNLYQVSNMSSLQNSKEGNGNVA
ncbi:MAG: hypothetical protein E6230_15915 [Paenibacillus dendritiformis]|uniref:hypothetical protein n=1 Tax=uncultured Paenibacillus sp. TaxID=227322 RepID=UPI0025EF80BB|nr:hypothetical protein [uncultured Paenibacillus sp.]MDU5143664.1 hypothetical protein [Paenibacillus dendritiformis]